MVFLKLFPAVLSFLLLVAHFLRGGQTLLMLLALGFAVLLYVPRAWVARAAQTALVVGALEWFRTLLVLLAVRAREDLPYGRMVLILGLIAAATLASALVFRSGTLRRFYGLSETD